MPTLTFGPFRFDAANARLWRGTETLRLSPKSFAVLETLVKHPGQLVSKEALLEAVWPGVAVGDAVLSVNVRALRAALGDSTRVPQYIETVHRRGYRFIAPLTRADAQEELRAASDATAPDLGLLVGRDLALRRLHEAFARARNGERQVVFVTGEPGIGKTAVLDAFVASLGGETALSTARGQCIDHHGLGEAYLPVLDALGQLCRGADGERMVALLARHAPSWLVHLPSLVGVADAEVRRGQPPRVTPERMLREIGEALEVLTADRPAILVLEDLHWADGATVDLLAWLARRRQAARLLVVGTYRPVDVIVVEHPLRSAKHELVAQRLCTELALELLSEAEVAQYLAGRRRERGVPAALPALLHRRTGGNPLFLTTVVDDLLRTDAAWDSPAAVEDQIRQVPESLRGAITQQLAYCNDGERAVLEAASVAGAEFAAAAVAAGVRTTIEDVEARCAGLARRGQFLQEAAVEEWPDGTVTACYRFRHVLHRQTVYEQVAASERVRLHRRIAEQLETSYGARAAERAIELAEHFEEGRVHERAALHFRQAGRSALRRSAYRDAVALLTRGLRLLPEIPDTAERRQQRLELHLTLGTALTGLKGQTDPEVEQAFGQARRLFHDARHTPQLFWALIGLRKYYTGRARVPVAGELAEQCLHMAERLGRPELVMEAHYGLGNVSLWPGDLARARGHLEHAIQLHSRERHEALTEHVDLDPGVGGLMNLALVLWLQGYPEQARHRSDAAVALAGELAHPYSLTMAHMYAAKLHHFRRDPVSTAHHAGCAVALAEKHGFPWWLAVAAYRQGWAQMEQGEVAAGIARMEESRLAYHTAGLEIEQPFYLACLADAYARDARIEEAGRLLAEARALVDSTGETWCSAEVLRLEGELSLRQTAPRGREAHASFRRALEVARGQGARSWELRAATSLARLSQCQGKPDDARRVLAEVHGGFTEGFDTADLRDAEALLAAPAGRRRSRSRARD